MNEDDARLIVIVPSDPIAIDGIVKVDARGMVLITPEPDPDIVPILAPANVMLKA